MGTGFLHVHLEDGADTARAARVLEARLGHTVRKSAEGAQLAVIAGSARAAADAVSALITEGIAVADFSMGSPSLDEVFFSLTGRDQTEDSAGEKTP